MTLQPTAQWVRNALEATGMSQAELARALAERMRRDGDEDRSLINKIVHGRRELSAAEMLAIEEITGVPIPSPNIVRRVPLVDWVSAGKLVETHSQVPAGEKTLPFADLGKGEFVALQVAGDSMDRISPPNSIIVVNLKERDLVNGRFYVFSLRGETTYKMWNSDPPYLAPQSFNVTNKPVFIKRKRDLAVIGRVRRTVLDL